jgi:hypothetical protein
MGEAKQRKRERDQSDWPRSDGFQGLIDLDVFPLVAAIDGARIRALTGDDRIFPFVPAIFAQARPAASTPTRPRMHRQ